MPACYVYKRFKKDVGYNNNGNSLSERGAHFENITLHCKLEGSTDKVRTWLMPRMGKFDKRPVLFDAGTIVLYFRTIMGIPASNV